jgi:hypothetical protein
MPAPRARRGARFLGVISMKSSILAAAAAAVLLMNSSSVFAQAMTQDDLAWINRCVSDNKRQGATQEVVRKYCICMNEEMDDNERLSISAWERKNPDAVRKCDAVAGWK